MQSPPLPEKPGLHVQLLIDPLPGRESVLSGQSIHCNSSTAPEVFKYFPESHSVQPREPDTGLKLPGAHCMQGPPSGPENPRLQEQSVESMLPGSDSEFPVHCVQA